MRDDVEVDEVEWCEEEEEEKKKRTSKVAFMRQKTGHTANQFEFWQNRARATFIFQVLRTSALVCLTEWR